MSLFLTRTALAAITALASAGAFAVEPVLYQSASFVAGEPGDYSLDDTTSIGNAFRINRAADVSAIGGYFSQFSDGDIFGAIVPLASLRSTPAAAIDSIALAHVVFTPDGTDQTVALTVHLDPGVYGVVFGSGLFGATGTSGLVSGQDSAGNRTFTSFGTSWSAIGDSDIRTVVYGVTTAVPEPESLALMLAGLAGVGVALRRQRADA